MSDHRVKVAIAEIMKSFRRFEHDAFMKLTVAGVPSKDTSDILNRAMYGCLFETIHSSMRISGEETGDVPFEKAFNDERIHERIANKILSVMLRNLEATRSKYNWRILIVKEQRKL